MAHRLLRRRRITPRVVYDAANRVQNETGRLSYALVAKALGQKPIFVEVFATCSKDCNRIRFAYFAAKAGKPYPSGLDDPDYYPGWHDRP